MPRQGRLKSETDEYRRKSGVGAGAGFAKQSYLLKFKQAIMCGYAVDGVRLWHFGTPVRRQKGNQFFSTNARKSLEKTHEAPA
jgi:hypothetical protein